MLMDFFNSLLVPAAVVMVMFGARFVVFASVGFLLTDPSRQSRRGHVHIERPAHFQLAANVRRELWQSLRTVLIFAVMIAFIYKYELLGSSQIYAARTFCRRRQLITGFGAGGIPPACIRATTSTATATTVFISHSGIGC